MFKKKGIIILIILLLLGGLAFTGSSALAQTMTKEQVTLITPYTRIGTGSGAEAKNRTISYTGSGYSAPLGFGDIYVLTYSGGDVATFSGGQLEDSFPINPGSVVPDGSGNIAGSFTIPLNKLPSVPVAITYVEIWIKGMGTEVKAFEVDRTPPSIVFPTSFIPDNNSKIYNYATITLDENQDSTLDPLYIWLKKSSTSGSLIYNSSDFADPASLLFKVAGSGLKLGYEDGSSLDPNHHDLFINYDDQAGNGNSDATPNSCLKINIKVYEYLDPNELRNAKTAIDDTGACQISVPRFSDGGILEVSGASACRINLGSKVRVLTGVSDLEISDDNKWYIITVGGADINALFPGDDSEIIAQKWTTVSNLTVAVNTNEAGPYEIYFGAEEGVGPRLIKSQVTGDKTLLTFSESLLNDPNTQADLNGADIEVDLNNDGVFQAYDGVVTFSSTDNASLELSTALDDGAVVRISVDNNAIRDMRGNLAETVNNVLTMTARYLTSVKVTDVDVVARTTTIEIGFDGDMDPDVPAPNAIVDPSYYDITIVPMVSGVALDMDPNDGLVDQKAACFTVAFSPSDPNTVVLTVNGLLENTGANLPQVTVSDQLKGLTGGDLIVTTAETRDGVGPYLVSASYNRNPENLQLFPDAVNNHLLTLIFSEPIDPNAPGADWTAAFSGVTLGTTSAFEESGSVVTITMGEDAVEVNEGVDNIAIDNANMAKVKDLAGNNASDSSNVLIADATIPWIVDAYTVDGATPAAGNGRIEALELVWNEAISQSFEDESLVLANSIVGSDNIISGITDPANTTTMQIGLVEKATADTGITPGFTLYLDPNNFYTDGDNQVDAAITLTDSQVRDMACPHVESVDFVKISGSIYSFRMELSEAIDPNVWQDSNNASLDLGMYSDASGTTQVNPNPVGKYVTSGCLIKPSILTFNADLNGVDQDSMYLFPLGAGCIFDLAGNDAYGAAAGITMVKSASFSVTDVYAEADNAPLYKSSKTMDLKGEIRDRSGNLVNADDWKVYAYSLENLYRYAYLNSNGDTISNGNKGITPSAALASVTADLAPAGLCYGSTKVQANGKYYMHIYGRELVGQDTYIPGFAEGEPIFLVVEDASGNEYLVTNNCAADSSYYCAWTEIAEGLETHNIDLSKYEQKNLAKGWNLISISTLKRYVGPDGQSGRALQDPNGLELDSDTCPVVSMGNLGQVLTSLDGQWSRIFTVDNSQAGADAIRTEYPAGSGFPIQFFSIGYGYWIYVPYATNAKLVVLGDVVDDNSARYQLPLGVGNDGWNLVGCWGGEIKFTSSTDNVQFSSAADSDSPLPLMAIENAFWSLDSLSKIRAYDNGIKTWFTEDPSITDLTYVGPGFGYWVKIDAPCTLKWHAPAL